MCEGVGFVWKCSADLFFSELAKAAGFDQHASVAVAIKRYEIDGKRMPTERKLLMGRCLIVTNLLYDPMVALKEFGTGFV